MSFLSSSFHLSEQKYLDLNLRLSGKKKRILSSFNFKYVKIFLVNIQDYLNPHTNYLIKSKTYDNIINQSWWAFEVIMIQLSILDSIMTKKKGFLAFSEIIYVL